MHGGSWILSSALALVLGVVLAAPAGAAMPDAWITMKTKLALLTTAGVSGMTINVDTVFGRVTLHGTVRSAEEQAKAETVARQINGVQGVSNLLQVVTAPDEQAGQVADDALMERITQELQADPALHDSRIAVQSVHQGVVLLAGRAKTLSDHLHAVAEADAHTVSGVQSVVNDLQVVARAEQAAVQARDDELAQAVRTAFATPTFKNITVVVQNGVVRLTGTIPTGAQRLEAAVVARAIPGVRAVQDDLRLGTTTP